MARYEFGRSLDDPDTLVIQGREYTMMPIGVRVMRSVLTKRRALVADLASTDVERQAEASDEMLSLMLDLIVSAVVPDEREQLRTQLDESVGAVLVGEIAGALLGNLSDLNPTQPGSSSNGSTPTGRTSTAGVAPAESTPAN
jgi:hypothetical protein